MVHTLLKPGLGNFQSYFTSVWDECNCGVVWEFFGIAFLWDWNENWPFPVLWPLVFFKFAGILSAALSQHHLLIFSNSSAGISSPPLALFVAMLPKAHLTSCSRMSGSRWVGVITPSWLSGSWSSFLYSSSVYSYHLFLIASASIPLGPYHFCPLLSPSLHEMFPWYL